MATGNIGKYDSHSKEELSKDIQMTLDRLDNPELKKLGNVIAECIHDNVVSGKYKPSLDNSELIKIRNDAIKAEFTGRNREAVMAKFGISRRLFYNIISRK